jgi:signal peptidase I
VVQDYDPAVNDRFASGYPDAPVPNDNPKFLGKGLDWSGVGWWKKDPQYSVTLLSSKNFAYTRHEAPQVGDVIVFFGGDGHLHEYHVAKTQQVQIGQNNGQDVYADSAVGTFDETVAADDQVCHYPIAFSARGFDAFSGKKILTYGHPARIGTNEIVEGIMVKGMASEYNFDTSGLSPGWGKSEIGDSGSPAFLVIGGKLALVGTHWKDDTDSMVSGIIPEMNALMAADGAKLDILPLGD